MRRSLRKSPNDPDSRRNGRARIAADFRSDAGCKRANGASLQGVADGLNLMGHRTQRGTPWQKGTVYTFLRRENLSVQPPPAWIGTSDRRRAQVDTTTERYSALIDDVKRLREKGETLAQIARSFNKLGRTTYRGWRWSATGLANLLQRQGGVVRQSTDH